MTPAEAKRLLRMHSGRGAGWQEGFIGQLRPYRGTLEERHFLEVMAAIRVLAPEIAKARALDRDLIADLWTLVWLPRVWAFPPGGMLRRNGLMDGQELSRLDDWLNRISEAVSYALEGYPRQVKDAMIAYGEPLPDFLTGKE